MCMRLSGAPGASSYSVAPMQAWSGRQKTRRRVFASSSSPSQWPEKRFSRVTAARLVAAWSGDQDSAEDLVDPFQDVAAEFDSARGDVVVHLLGPRRADDGARDTGLAENPGQCQLRHRDPEVVGDRP